MTRSSFKYLILFLFLPSQGFAQKPLYSTAEGFLTDSLTFVVFTANESTAWMFKGVEPSFLSGEEILQVETILSRSIEVYNALKEKEFDSLLAIRPSIKERREYFIINLPQYKRQYIPTVNKNGEKEVRINCFCRTHTIYWLKDYVSVRDGGNCYFKLTINLSNGTYSELSVNGDV